MLNMNVFKTNHFSTLITENQTIKNQYSNRKMKQLINLLLHILNIKIVLNYF